MLNSQGSGIESNGCTCEAIGWLWRGINTLRLLFGAALLCWLGVGFTNRCFFTIYGAYMKPCANRCFFSTTPH